MRNQHDDVMYYIIVYLYSRKEYITLYQFYQYYNSVINIITAFCLRLELDLITADLLITSLTLSKKNHNEQFCLT